MRMMFGAAFSLAAMLVCNVAIADDSYKTNTGHRTVMSGVRTKIGQNYHINNDCTAAPMPPTVVIKPPAHGKIEIVKEKVFPKSNGPLAKCSSVKVSGVAGYYTSKPGFAGKDKLTLRSPFGDGKIADTTVIIIVLK